MHNLSALRGSLPPVSRPSAHGQSAREQLAERAARPGRLGQPEWSNGRVDWQDWAIWNERVVQAPARAGRAAERALSPSRMHAPNLGAVRGPASRPPSRPASEPGSSPCSPVGRSPKAAPRCQRFSSGGELPAAGSPPWEARAPRPALAVLPEAQERGRSQRRVQRRPHGRENTLATYDRFDSEGSTVRPSLTLEQRQQIALGFAAASAQGALLRRAQSPHTPPS